MMKLAMSPAASGLLRSLLQRAEVTRDRILLTEWRSVDWQSLTLIGERHQVRLRIPGPGAAEIAERITDGLEDAEFCIPRQIVADITVTGRPRALEDGAIELTMEALTVEE
ncbi:MAG: hypothetical protein ACJ8EY_02250 [Sphingomicrobium sp.]